MKKTLSIINLDCANCALKLERALSKIDGVNNVTVNFFAQKILIDFNDDMIEVVKENVYAVTQKTLKGVKILNF